MLTSVPFRQLCHSVYALFPGHSVSRLLANLPETALTKDLKKIILLGDKLLKSLTCLNPKKQKAHDSLWHCKVIASKLPSVQPQEEFVAGDEKIQYQQIVFDRR